MKKITKSTNIQLGNDFSFTITIDNDKTSVTPTFSLFSIGKEKQLSSFICFKRENNISLFNFKSKTTTNFNIRIFEETYESSNVLRIISVFGEESYYYLTNADDNVFYNPETNIKVKKTTEGSTTKYTFITSNEDEITYTKSIFGGSIISPVEYKYKNSVKYIVTDNGVTSLLNNNSFNGPKVEFIKNSDGSINEVRIYSIMYNSSLSENKYKKVNFTYNGDFISQIIVTEFNGKIDTYNLTLNSATQWKVEHLESNKYVLFNFDSNGNLINYLFDDIGSSNSSYVVSFEKQTDSVKISQNNKYSICVFDENGNISHEFDGDGNINYYEYFEFKKDYFKEKSSSTHNLRFEKINDNNLLVGNFSDQVLGNWTFNSGGTGTYSIISSTLGNDYSIFTNGYGTKISVGQGSSTSSFKTNFNEILSNRKFIFSGFYKSLVVGTSTNFSVIFRAKNKGNFTGENIIFDLDISSINKTKFFMKEIFFKNDLDQVEIQIEFYRGSEIEIYNFSLLEEIFGTINFYNENGIAYKSINGFDVSRTKIHDGHIKELSFYNKNIKIDDEVENQNEITKTSHISKNVKNIVKINANNGTLKSKETIYGNNVEKIKEESTYSDNGLLSSKVDSLGITTNYTYYLNTDLYKNINSLIQYSFTYSGANIRTVVNSSSPSPYISDYTPNFSSRSLQIKENNIALYNSQHNYEGDTIYFKYNNVYFIQNLYIKGNSNCEKLLSISSLNNTTLNYSINYNSNDLLTRITHNSNVIFGFEYDTLDRLKRVSMTEVNKYYAFTYDETNDLKTISSSDNGVIAYKDKGKLNYTNQTFLNGYSLFSFNQEYQNRNAVILNDLMTELKEKPYYVGLFDSTIDPNDNHEEFKYLKLINKFYEKDDFISINYYFNGGAPYIVNLYNLTCLHLLDYNYVTFSHYHPVIDSKISGNIGFSWLINRIANGQQNLISFNLFDYSINLYYLKESTNTINLVVKYGTTTKINKSYNVTIDNSSFNPINISYECTSTSFKINLFAMGVFYSNKFNNSVSITNTEVTYRLFEPWSPPNYPNNNEFFVTGIIYDNKSIPFNSIIDHFNIIDKIESLSEVYKENFDYCPNGSGSINYLGPSNQFVWIPFKNSLKDSNNNYPITNLGYKNPFIFHLMTMGNCYYAHYNKLVYRTNLMDKGAINFKTKLFKISAEQPYFCLKNSYLYIKAYVDENCNIKLKINDTIKTLYGRTVQELTQEHAITFSYAISNNVFYYNLQFSSNSASSGNVPLNLNITNETFELYIGCSEDEREYTDIDGNVTRVAKETFNGIFSDVIYTNRLDSLSYNNSLLTPYKNPIISDSFTDVFGREYQKRIVYQNKMVLNEKYNYKVIENNQTPLVSKEKILLNTTVDNHDGALNRSVSYTYDNMNRIQKIIEIVNENGNDFTEKTQYIYSYNSNSFLTSAIIVKEKKQNNVVTTVFTNEYNYQYNSDGDLSLKNEVVNGSSVSKSLTYSSNIKHQLTKIADNNLIYDGLFLKEIRSNSGVINESFNYRGTKLSHYYNRVNNIDLDFFYDYEGKRILKYNINTDENIHYYYDFEGKLISEKHNSYILNFIYDAKGRLFSLIYQTNSARTPYFYIRNALNDITEIVDSNGNSVAKYTYDPFGKIIEISGSNTNNIANLNPFRYRGYYYDIETQLYWVSSRYYSPELCRWISPDSIEYLEPESINGLNLYAYCGNDPVNKYDPTGHFGIWALVAITAASMLIGGTAQLVSNAMAGKTGSELWRGVAGAAVGAGVNALALCLAMPTGGASLFIAAGASAIAQTGVDTLETVIRGEEVDVGQTFIDLGLNFVTTLAGNYLGGKMIPTNPGWFQPQKFLSVFTKSYGQKILLQTAIGAGLSGTVNFIRKNDWSKYKPIIPMPVLPLYRLF